MNIEAPFKDNAVPLLRTLAKQALDDGAPSLTFNRRAKKDREAAILILMLHDAAVRDLGPMLAHFAHQIKQHSTANYILSGDTLELEEASKVFEIMDSKNLKWGWTRVDIAGLEATLVAFVGTEICKELVSRIKDHCPVSKSFQENLGLPTEEK